MPRSSTADSGGGARAANDLKESQRHRAGRHEALVDEHVDRIGMIDGDELHLIGVRRLPQLLGELQDVAAVARLERVAGNAHVLLRRAGGREGARAAPMRPSGMPSALRHIASVTKRKRFPSHV